MLQQVYHIGNVLNTWVILAGKEAGATEDWASESGFMVATINVTSKVGFFIPIERGL